MTDMRRTLLWVIFTMSLVLLWDAWQKHNGQPSMFSPAPAKTAAPAPGAAGGPAPTATPAATGGGVPTPAAVATGGAAPALPSGAPAAAAQTVTVTTDVVRATFSTRGGELQKLELLRHRDPEVADRQVVLFDQSPQRVYLAQTGLITNQPGVALPNHLSTLQLTSTQTELKDGESSVQVRFETPDAAAGVKLTKTYTLKRGDYTIGVQHQVANAGAAAVEPQLYLQLVRDGNPPPGESAFYFTFTGPALYTEAKKFQKLDFKDIEKNKADHEKAADNGWVAMVQHYFASAWIVGERQPREFRTAKVGDNLYSIATVVPLGSVAPGASVAHEARLFAGPQEEKKLAELAPGLELVKDYGWFTVLAKPLFWLLDRLYGVIGNWGWAIVALVFLLKAAFYWLNASAYRSMGKMKAINPRIMELRERMKDKPQQMQQEMMRIYKEEKVNPLGGCLPILVQMPFFIALYWVLLSSVEMRNAPWLGWITDLAAKDPYFILPLLMTASSLLQTWLNPTPPDPVQAKLMWIMPIAFSFMFFFFPAGLVLYWLTNNILSIAQQWMINKQLGVLGK
ncbi:MAG: membrane protein insertase YidC [Betaproteobacteria bacterium]|nr:membrane protein insertase YidC [Betaproteobacteria bacterium]NBU49326.1 membrane protein insertase YidC [Betaproteobacteria bacterium]